VLNDMPADTVNFRTLTDFKKSIMPIDHITAHLNFFP